MTRIIHHLTNDCSWPLDRIHLFGFAQGGTVATELCISWWKSTLSNTRGQQDGNPISLGSVVTVCGPLLSFPTVLSSPCPTPILVAHRPPPAETALPPNALGAFRKGFSTIRDVSIGRGEGMPRSRDEWEPIMRFWSERLSRRPVDGLYEVVSAST